MPLNLSRESDRITLIDADLVPDGDKDVTYIVRPLTAQAAARLRQRSGRSSEELIYAMLDHCLESWTGVNVDGQPADCDKAHKIMLPLNVASAIVDRAAERVVSQEAQQRESFRPA
jgi:hypothetical protein